MIQMTFKPAHRKKEMVCQGEGVRYTSQEETTQCGLSIMNVKTLYPGIKKSSKNRPTLF